MAMTMKNLMGIAVLVSMFATWLPRSSQGWRRPSTISPSERWHRNPDPGK
jgi:hypothetical protein